MKITFIGAGNMGGAMAHGLYQTDLFKPSDITCTARSKETLEKCSAMMPGIHTSRENREAVTDADIVVFAVKPWLVEDIIDSVKEQLDYSRQIIISVAAGVSLNRLEASLDKGTEDKPALFYMIPNTAIDVKSSMTFFVPRNASDEQRQLVMNLFSEVGGCMEVTEKQMPACLALASCGIAYAFRYIRASVEGGVELGLYPRDAQTIVANTVKGAAEMLLQHKSHPEQEIDCVTTPGGMTIKGLNAMEEAGFTNAVIKGLKAGK